MRKRVHFDSETCGLHGLAVLLQYKFEGGPIVLHEVWKEPIAKTIDLIDLFCESEVIGFNLTFDWFHICKLRTILSQFPGHLLPETIINEIGEVEQSGQDGPCVKPYSALDLLLYSRKGPYQSLMAREDIRIRRVPSVLAYQLRDELEQRVEIDGIYFARRKDKSAPRWNVYDIPNEDRTGINPDFKDIVLKFHPAGGLKFLAEHVLGITDTVQFSEIEVDPKYHPIGDKFGYAPYATAISRPEDDWSVFDVDGVFKGKTWPGVIQHHIEHWHSHEKARHYAEKDVVYTEGLDLKWAEKAGLPYLPTGDDDSVLACMVGAVRWRGFNIDLEGLKELYDAAARRAEGKALSPGDAREYLREVMDDMEFITIRDTTSKIKLEEVSKWACDCTAGPDHKPIPASPDCDVCGGKGIHPAGQRATEVLDGRKAVKECELYAKLLTAKKFHASLNVIGTLSSRMSGADGLNAQGIKREAWVRGRFPMARDPYVLCGGDFSSFEVTLADAAYGDPQLREDLKTGRKIHAEMAAFLYGYTYEQIVEGVKAEASAALAEEKAAKAEGREMRPTESKFTTMYSNGKQAVFALIYGGDHGTISRKLGVPKEVAEQAYVKFLQRYPLIAAARKKIFDMFCSMRQEAGIGTAITWSEPADYVESLLGFRRYFTLENKICAVLFDMAQNPPKEFRGCHQKVIRRDRVQTASGAASSAIYGAAFQIQAAAMRAAANHVIQSTGAEITKRVERNIWNVQPHGVHPWRTAPLNIHDEILAVTDPAYADEIDTIVKSSVESYRDRVPLIGISWGKNLTSWADTH
jgi:DNA polymerase family A